MKFNEYLKHARWRNQFTQEDASTKLGVSINTIQNWENSTLPDRGLWENLINIYGLNKDEFMKTYMDSVITNDQRQYFYKLPQMLKDIIDKISDLKFSEQEQELFGLQTLYGEEHLLPYKYVSDTNPFQVLNINDQLTTILKDRTISIREKTFYLEMLRSFVKDCLKENPYKLFDIKSLTNIQYFSLLQYLYVKDINKDYYYHQEKLISIYETLKNAYTFYSDLDFKKMLIGENVKDQSYNQHFQRIENINSEIIDCNACLKHPYDLYFHIIDEKQKDAEYLQKEKDYQEALKVYNTNPEMYRCKPTPPFCKINRYLILTNDGKELLNWYKQFFGTKTE